MGDRHEHFQTGSTLAHKYAATESYDELVKFLDENQETVTHRDKNGWTPLAEAARTGNAEVVRLLLDRGSELNARVGKNEEGGSILWIAQAELGEDHDVVGLLKERGARIVEPSARQDL
jgi:ankyrin repeat protein